MPFVFHTQKHFALIDYTPRLGVFCQFFSLNSNSRTFSIQPSHHIAYSATMDQNEQLHTLCMPNSSIIYYISLQNGILSNKLQVAKATENYTLSSPGIYCIGNELYISYISKQLSSSTYSFVFQSLDGQVFTTALTLEHSPELIKTFTYKDKIYIFYILFEQHYNLNCLIIDYEHAENLTLLQISFPIHNYSICIIDEVVHITYLADVHGKYQLMYYNTNLSVAYTLATVSSPYSPVIFSYMNYLWINCTIDNQLKVFLSIDQGASFSQPVTSSLQNNLKRASFCSQEDTTLNATELYMSIGHTIKLTTIYPIDFDHIHPDTKIPIEQELILEAYKLSSHHHELSSLEVENQRLKARIHDLEFALQSTPLSSSKFHSNATDTRPNYPPHHPAPTLNTKKKPHKQLPLASDYDSNTTPPPAPEQKSASPSTPKKTPLSSAKQDFMKELTSWDLPPRI